MTDGELRDELVTLLLAGHETTATSVAWAIERLVRHPDKLARLLAEIDAGEERGVHARRSSTRRCACARSCRSWCGCCTSELRGRAATRCRRARAWSPSIYLTNRNPRVYERPDGVPPRALPRTRARDVLLDPLRRRHPPLHRRVVRAAGDEADAAHDARASCSPQRAARRSVVAPRRVDPPARDHARAGRGRARGVAAALSADRRSQDRLRRPA